MVNNVLLLGISIIIIVLVLMYSRAQMILRTWAEGNCYQILSSDLRFLGRGPYSYTLLGKQWVFYVILKASDGTTRTGYVKCGSFFWGVIINRAEAKLDG